MFYTEAVKAALQQDPPGSWIPQAPKQCVRLHAGYPSPAVVPVQSLVEALRDLVSEEREHPLQYSGSRNMQRLSGLIRQQLAARGILSSATELLVTAGAAQAIDLCAHLFLDRTCAVAVESPTYMEALETFRNYTHDIVEVPVDEGGLNPDAFAKTLRLRHRNGLAKIKFLYTIPSFQNPTGTCMSLERRRRLLELADEFDFLIVEDDAYGELYFEAPPIPLKSLDGAGRVIYVGSLSKVVAPGIRIGWAAGPASFVQAMNWFKKDLNHPLMHALAATYLDRLQWGEYTQQLRDFYAERKDALIQSLDETMPRHVTWHEPTGGYFVWVHTPGTDTEALLPAAMAAGVSYLPGKYFYSSPALGREFLRLSFSYVDMHEFRSGLARLAQVLKNG